MQVVRVVVRFIGVINEGAGKISSFLIVGMMGAITVEVVLRYGFNSPTLWAHETAKFFYGSYSVLAGGYVLLHKDHVNMDVVYTRLSPRKKAILDLITSWLFFLFIGAMLWHGVPFAHKSVVILEHTNSIWSPPIWPVKLMLPLAALLILLQGIANFLRDLGIAVTGRDVMAIEAAKKDVL